jgi:hypothetical protein
LYLGRQDNETVVPPPSQSEDTSDEPPLGSVITATERAREYGPIPRPDEGGPRLTDGGQPAMAWAVGLSELMAAGAVRGCGAV